MKKTKIVLTLGFVLGYVALMITGNANARSPKEQGPHGLGCGCALTLNDCP